MSLLDYIKGNRKGKDAHRLEKESMRDPFLSEAIEGYDSVAGDHVSRIEDIHARIKNKSDSRHQNRRRLTWALAAACTVGVFIAGGYIVLNQPQSIEYTQTMADMVDVSAEVIDIYVPTAYYEDHETVIEDNNVVLETEPALAGAGSYLNIETDVPIRIYVPGEYYEENKETIEKAEEIFPRHNG